MTLDKKYDRPFQVAEGIYWVGFRDERSLLTCNPYLVVEGDQALLIDGGSRTDFSVVMMKILQTGIDPKQVVAMIYQHYDPDLCGSMPNFIDMFDNPALKIISEKRNNAFISFYISRDKCNLLESIDTFDYRFNLNGRIFEFIPTPYAHSPGSFATYDHSTRTLFSSDLFGSYATQWDLFLRLDGDCFTCEDSDMCPNKRSPCPVEELLAFHREIMPCSKALGYAMDQIKPFPTNRIAPQHGSLLDNPQDISFLMQKLKTLTDVGIDAL